VSKGKTP